MQTLKEHEELAWRIVMSVFPNASLDVEGAEGEDWDFTIDGRIDLFFDRDTGKWMLSAIVMDGDDGGDVDLAELEEFTDFAEALRWACIHLAEMRSQSAFDDVAAEQEAAQWNGQVET